VGTNLRIKPDRDHPCKLYYPLLNSDNRPDPVLTYWQGDTETVFAKRDRMLDQVSTFRKRFITYQDYAKAPIDSIVRPGAPFVQATEFHSMVLINENNGKFTWKPLPAELQRFPIFGIAVADMDHDGILDLLLTGNDRSYSNDIGHLDAGGVALAIGNGDGTFTSLDYEKIGIDSKNDVRAIGLISNPSERPTWLMSTNNGPWRCISLNHDLSTDNDHLPQLDSLLKKRKLEQYLGGTLCTGNQLNSY
jgi:hypothetical protein